MDKQSYASPPIIDAIIEFKFKGDCKEKELKKIIKKLKKTYENYERLNNVKVKIDIQSDSGITSSTSNSTPEITHRFSSENMTQQLLVENNGFKFSQLAPYGGWENFIERVISDFNQLRGLFGNESLERIGVRYVNRVDIPITAKIVEYEKYINVYPHLPSVLNQLSQYAVQAQIFLPDLESIVMLNSAIVKPILDNFLSIVIDQDIIKSDCSKLSNEEVFNYLESVRKKKNEIFESCITDKARELFS